MKSLSVIVVLIFTFAVSASGQTVSGLAATVRQIKLLQSTREDVKRILRDYGASDDFGHSQVFSNEDLSIEVTYSSGACTDNADEEDASEVWNVKEWVVTRIEIDPEEPIALQDAGFDLSTLKKEPRYLHATDAWVFHNKATGFAVKTDEDGIERLIFFPPRANSSKLCRMSSAAKVFIRVRAGLVRLNPMIIQYA